MKDSAGRVLGNVVLASELWLRGTDPRNGGTASIVLGDTFTFRVRKEFSGGDALVRLRNLDFRLDMGVSRNTLCAVQRFSLTRILGEPDMRTTPGQRQTIDEQERGGQGSRTVSGLFLPHARFSAV